jgi:hypothetical protein
MSRVTSDNKLLTRRDKMLLPVCRVLRFSLSSHIELIPVGRLQPVVTMLDKHRLMGLPIISELLTI